MEMAHRKRNRALVGGKRLKLWVVGVTQLNLMTEGDAEQVLEQEHQRRKMS